MQLSTILLFVMKLAFLPIAFSQVIHYMPGSSGICTVRNGNKWQLAFLLVWPIYSLFLSVSSVTLSRAVQRFCQSRKQLFRFLLTPESEELENL